MGPNEIELPVNPSQAEVVGFFALSLVSRNRALSAFFDYYDLTAVNVGKTIGKHPSRISQVVYSESAPKDIVEQLRSKVGVLEFLLPRPTDKGRAA